MKKFFIAIFLCLISLTLISCEKKSTATKTSPISSTTTKATQSAQSNNPTTTLSNDELTENYYKDMVKRLKTNKSSVVYFSFDLMK